MNARAIIDEVVDQSKWVAIGYVDDRNSVGGELFPISQMADLIHDFDMPFHWRYRGDTGVVYWHGEENVPEDTKWAVENFLRRKNLNVLAHRPHSRYLERLPQHLQTSQLDY